MRAQNNNHNKKETINTMTAMSRPQSPAAAEPGEEDPAQQPQPIALEYEDAAALIAALSPLAEEPLAAGGTTLDAGEGKKWSSAQGRCTQLRKLALHFEQQRGASSGILVRDVLSGDNVESYCKANAPKSLDSYSRGAMFWRKAVQQRCQGELCDAQTAELEKQRMDRLGVQAAASRRERQMQVKVLPLLAWHTLGEACLETLNEDTAQPVHALVGCMAYGLATRTSGLLNAKWGSNVTRTEGGDFVIELGKPGGSKNDKHMKILLSNLVSLGGIARPDKIATILQGLYDAGHTDGELVFGKTATEPHTDDDVRDVFQMVDEGVQPRMLRKTLESVADAFLHQDKITARARELLTYVLQHGAAASEVDYTRPMHDEQIPADRDDDEEPSDHAHDDTTGGEPDAGTPPAAERRVCWFSEVAARTEELYFRCDEITLIRLHAALAMATTVAADYATERQLHHAGAACDMMTERKRRRIE